MSGKKAALTILKVLGIFLLVIVGLIVLIIVGLNIYKYILYKDYYSRGEKMGKILGLNEGYVPQGITYFDNSFVSAGYMADGSVSRLYQYDVETKKGTYFTLTSNGKDFMGHTGGIQYENGYFYLANESDGLYKFSSDLVKNAENGSSIEIGLPLHVNNHSSFVFSDAEYLYVGEFNNDAKYACTNSITYNGVTHRAIVTKYSLSNLADPLAVYSIPNEIQGFCMTADGTIVLSRSYALTSSNFFVYRPDSIIKTDQLYDGVPVYFLDEPSENILGPAMSEDLDYVDGRVVTLFESACKKYFFGKLFFATHIMGLDI